MSMAGLVLSRAKGHDIQLVLLFLLLLPVTYYFTVVGIFRSYFPIEPILMVFTGYTMYEVACQCKGNVFHTVSQ